MRGNEMSAETQRRSAQQCTLSPPDARSDGFISRIAGGGQTFQMLQRYATSVPGESTAGAESPPRPSPPSVAVCLLERPPMDLK